jgi:hypothetical protein
MSIPLDRLYNFLDSINDHNLIIYRWYPHGSKKLNELTTLKRYGDNGTVYTLTNPIMICHDQEPLELDLISDEILNSCVLKWQTARNTNNTPSAEAIDFFKTQLNLRSAIDYDINVYDYVVLLHSEIGGNQLTQCQDWCVPVYYWSHALIARDWFRYANIDPLLKKYKTYTHDFLIYNRAWSGTREYRLKFSELIVNFQLDQFCKMGFSINDGQLDYRSYQFKNKNFCIDNYEIHNYFFNNTATSNASADYNAADYQSCAIEVVLETLFDDSKIHLTEKILRPIACGHPFILASTPGSLEYLRSYGFQTFEGLINEDYDQIIDPVARLTAIIKLMKNISIMSPDDKSTLIDNMNKIAKYNQDRFFSDDFQQHIIQEFKRNLDVGMEKMYQNRSGKYFKKKIKFITENKKSPWPALFSRQECAEIWKWLKRHN